MTGTRRMKSMVVLRSVTEWEIIFLFHWLPTCASTHLTANINNFPSPARTSLWNNIVLQFNKSHWQINASLLNTRYHRQNR